ncbi:hypothetical protein IGI04_017197 [Brassica rapa subsp. trilocularis]|uniref:Glycylpeptide N-tetradecanoyltransferase n=1 Tax=Brassica rapa subsp. trilocularis TaxID=1813537 RepID=A0ABQ7MVE4_BRACM|nr:hypothetical protein IGI04_017197 [Brassica rapa subsp. trilocularis]
MKKGQIGKSLEQGIRSQHALSPSQTQTLSPPPEIKSSAISVPVIVSREIFTFDSSSTEKSEQRAIHRFDYLITTSLVSIVQNKMSFVLGLADHSVPSSLPRSRMADGVRFRGLTDPLFKDPRYKRFFDLLIELDLNYRCVVEKYNQEKEKAANNISTQKQTLYPEMEEDDVVPARFRAFLHEINESYGAVYQNYKEEQAKNISKGKQQRSYAEVVMCPAAAKVVAGSGIVAAPPPQQKTAVLSGPHQAAHAPAKRVLPQQQQRAVSSGSKGFKTEPRRPHQVTAPRAPAKGGLPQQQQRAGLSGSKGSKTEPRTPPQVTAPRAPDKKAAEQTSSSLSGLDKKVSGAQKEAPCPSKSDAISSPQHGHSGNERSGPSDGELMKKRGKEKVVDDEEEPPPSGLLEVSKQASDGSSEAEAEIVSELMKKRGNEKVVSDGSSEAEAEIVNELMRKKGKGKVVDDEEEHPPSGLLEVSKQASDGPHRSEEAPSEVEASSPAKAELKREPKELHSSLELVTCDLSSDDMCAQVQTLLKENFSDTATFDLSKDYLRWALQPWGYKKEWHMGICSKRNKKLLGFISGVPIKIQIGEDVAEAADLNFLCVQKGFKKFSFGSLGSFIIDEMRRRVDLEGVSKAVYLTVSERSTPSITCQPWYRALKEEKQPLPAATTQTPGLRPMLPCDVPAVTKLIRSYLRQFRVSSYLEEADVTHWLLPRDKVVYSYVVVNPSTEFVTDFFSFYARKNSDLNVAFSFYHVARDTSTKTLMSDALVVAKESGFDFFGALDIMGDRSFLKKKLKFVKGKTLAYYHFSNFNLPHLKPREIGVNIKAT